MGNNTVNLSDEGMSELQTLKKHLLEEIHENLPYKYLRFELDITYRQIVESLITEKLKQMVDES